MSHPELPIALLLLASLTGCVERPPQEARDPFEARRLDACLAIIVDMSGSFANSWDDRAYTLFLELIDRFFTEGEGAETRVIIGQLSGTDKVVLFEGHAGELRERFTTPEQFNEFLAMHSDPKQSPVYESMGEMLRYVNAISGITQKTRLMTVVLSDMEDNSGNLAERKRQGAKMLAQLKIYQQLGGGLALYFVAQDEIPRWRKIMDAAGFEPGTFVIENTIVASPQLPRFD